MDQAALSSGKCLISIHFLDHIHHIQWPLVSGQRVKFSDARAVRPGCRVFEFPELLICVRVWYKIHKDNKKKINLIKN